MNTRMWQYNVHWDMKIKKIKTETVVLQETANSLGLAMLCSLMRVSALWADIVLQSKWNKCQRWAIPLIQPSCPGWDLTARGGSRWQADHHDAPLAPPGPLDHTAHWSQAWNITLSLKSGHVSCVPGYPRSSETQEWTRAGIIASKPSDCFVSIPPPVSKSVSFLWQPQQPKKRTKIYLKFLGLFCVCCCLANGRNKPAFC